jgi:hypothetical protein
MAGRDIGLGLGLLAVIRANGPVKPWLIAAVLADNSDITGTAGAWRYMAPSQRWVGLGIAGGAAVIGSALLAPLPPD